MVAMVANGCYGCQWLLQNHSLKADVEEARVYIDRCEATNERMQDRLQVSPGHQTCTLLHLHVHILYCMYMFLNER